ncbi:HNH endonuclease signature motif containing protein [Streptomyces flavovirens]|uniref:HNH endonuclease signature motif containing protein n=1 Tax=Streptomyces flavovirens TaxID=52258 RepID=UPI003D146AB6
MAIGSTARKILWARSSDVCAFPDCDQQLTVNLHDDGSKSLEAAGIPLGEEAHIISGSKGGPRYDALYPPEKVDTYENLILLCPTHHRLIDKKGGAGFTVETLRKIKSDHELSQRSQKTSQQKRNEEIELRTIALIEAWANKADLDRWESLIWKLNVPIQRLKEDEIANLTQLGEWAMTRSWPPAYPEVARSFDNYSSVLCDTINHIRKSFEPIEGRDDIWEIYREYKHRLLSQEGYDAALKDFEYRSDVLCELSLELTKAANFVCAAVRSELDPLFRFEEGVLPHRVGDGVFSNTYTREEYGNTELDQTRPYPGNKAIEERVRKQGGASR